MPEVVVYLLEGRSREVKKALMKDITDAVVRNCSVNPDAVIVTLVETARDDKSKAGVPFSER
jgi:4-oxalocrotonate tautomerase